MSSGQSLILTGVHARNKAKELIDAAPTGCIVNVRLPTRSTVQNAKLWAMLGDISRAKPGGRCHTPDVWKALAMHACGHAVQFETGLDGAPFPLGFRSSKLNKQQMSELIEFLYEFGARHNIAWTDEARAA